MFRSGWFERRLLIALVLFSLIPTLVLIGVGTILLREAVSLQTTPAGWERLGETGRILLERAEESGDPELLDAAQRHRQELTTSIQQAQRWGYLNRRVLAILPWVALVLVVTLAVFGVRSARRIARELASPIHDLVGWSGRVARGEPLPGPNSQDGHEAGEFGVLRQSFRAMARELEISRARALEAAGIRASVTLARGVAHELKNALTPLRLAVRVLRTRTEAGSIEGESLEVIDSESQRLETLARAFSQLGRPPEGAPSQIDLVEMLDYLARTHLPPRIQCRLMQDGAVPPIHGYYDSLSRAFANLILNAAEAMGEAEGSLEISFSADGGRHVEVRILDSGSGLPPGVEDRIWDPDFTTKARGTGLGLSLVRQTVHAHGGRITAANRQGGGAEFRVALPTTPPEVAVARDEVGAALPA